MESPAYRAPCRPPGARSCRFGPKRTPIGRPPFVIARIEPFSGARRADMNRSGLAAPTLVAACLSPAGSASSARPWPRPLVDPGATVSSSTRSSPSTAATRFNVADIADRVHVNISDVRDPHSLATSSSGQDVPLQPGRPDEPPRLDDRPVHRPRDQLPQPALDSRGLPPQQPGGPKSSSPSTRQLYGRPRYLPVDEEHPLVPGRRQRDQQARRRVVPPALQRRVRHPRRGAAADQHLRPAHARQGRPPDVPRLLAPPGLRRGARRSSATAPSCATSPTSTTPSTRSCSPARVTRPYGQVFNLGCDRGRQPARAGGAARRVHGKGATSSCRSRPIARRSTSATTTATAGRSSSALGWQPTVDLAGRPEPHARVLPRARRRATGTR